MAAIIRQGIDKSSGHNGYAPRAADSGSPDVIVNGQGIVRTGDHYPPHNNGRNSHDGIQGAGSSTVIVNGKSAARAGDPISCGDTAAGGSSDVVCG
jgi:uncharacterized Zn-binding protein involved in type VI secretion